MSTSESLAVAGRLYYWKPALALSRAFMLEEYARAGLPLAQPLLDLGCGDSRFALALCRRGVVPEVDVGLDYDLEDLRSTVWRPRSGVVRGDLTALPFAEASFGSLFCNTVLSSFVGGGIEGLRAAIAEMARILRPGGHAVFIVGTSHFTKNLVAYRLLTRLGWQERAERYAAWVNRRNSHTVLLDEAEWAALLEEAGLKVMQRRYLLTRRDARLLSWTAPIRGTDLPRRLGLPGADRLQGAMQARLLQAVLGKAFQDAVSRPPDERRADASFLFLVGTKPG